MNDRNPLLNTLAAASSLADCADWLLRCPVGILHSDQKEIRGLLIEAGCAKDSLLLGYLGAQLAEANARRLSDGSVAFTIKMAVHLAIADMKIAVREGRLT